MPTITINTFLTDAVSREELVQVISRLPAGGNTRTEIIDDETGEVLYTCQRGQVQMTTEVLAAVLANKQDVHPDSEDADEGDNDDTQPLSITIDGTTFTVGDRVRAKRNDEHDYCYHEKDKGIIVNIDETDDTYPLLVRFDKGNYADWTCAEDFDIISK